MNKEGLIQLHIAIIEQARKDFMRLFPRRNCSRYRFQYESLINDIKGNYFASLLPFDMTPEKIIELWTKEAEELKEGENKCN